MTRAAFLPVEMVLWANQEEGIRTLTESMVDPTHVRVWNGNAMRFDVFTIISPCQDAYGWMVNDDHPRWGLV